MTAAIAGSAVAFPPALEQHVLWEQFFSARYRDQRVFPAAERIWHSAGVERRHGAVDPRVEDISAMSTGARMQRFVDEALPLGKEAAAASLAAAGVAASDVGLLTIVSCTGYATPGLDILVARDLAMAPSVQRVNIGHMGCYGALPGLATVADAAVARGKVGLLLCVEVTSLHIQPPSCDLEQVVTHALFSDGAAAVTVLPDAPGLEIVEIISRTDASTAACMTWDITDLGFRMGLSSEVPGILQRHVPSMVEELLAGHGLRVRDVPHWAIHPGGPRIVDVVADRLRLTDDQVEPSRTVLRDHGNCSSASVLVVLEHISSLRRPQPHEPIVAMAFGPGLSLYAALMRQR